VIALLYELFSECLQIKYRNTGKAANYAMRRTRDTLYIFFEKSNGARDWYRNLDFPAKPYKRMGRTLWLAHRGFLHTWKEVEGDIAAAVTDMTVKQIIITGYSHGAALAVFCHEFVWYHRPDLRDQLRGYGFGCPRVYWGLPVGKCTRRWENFTVIRNLNDIVTHVPPAVLGYSHVGTVLEIGVKGRYTPIEAHYEENILTMLAEYEAYLKTSMETALARGSSEAKINSLSPATSEISR
jgi:hypothetical protein